MNIRIGNYHYEAWAYLHHGSWRPWAKKFCGGSLVKFNIGPVIVSFSRYPTHHLERKP